MRLSPILLQGAAAAQATARSRPKLPLPATFPPNFKARLLPSLTSQIPSVVNCPTTFAPIFIRPDQKMRLQLWGDGKYFFKWFKAWITFYRAGIAQTVANMRLRKQLKKELKSCMRNVNIPGSMNITMTRSEFQMMVRTRQDMMKLPVFLFLMFITAEFMPIVLWLLGSWFLPYTCLPQRYLENRQRKRMDDLDRKKLPYTPRVFPTIAQVNDLPRRTLIHECRLLGVFWRRAPIYIYPTAYLRERLIRRVNYLEYDDELLRIYGNPELNNMSLDEVKRSLVERGVSIFNIAPAGFDNTGLIDKRPEELYKLLVAWLTLNNNKHPKKSFSHEMYLKEMIRFGRISEL